MTNADTTPLQYHICYSAMKRVADRDKIFLFMVNCKENPLDRETLQKLVDRYQKWEIYKNWIPKLPTRKELEEKRWANRKLLNGTVWSM